MNEQETIDAFWLIPCCRVELHRKSLCDPPVWIAWIYTTWATFSFESKTMLGACEAAIEKTKELSGPNPYRRDP